MNPASSRGWVWRGGKRAWSQGHRLWLRSLRFEQAADQAVLEDDLLAIEQVEERLQGLEEHIEAVSQQTPYAQAVGALRCFRGIDSITAMTIVAELHSFIRFDSPRGLMSHLGLFPSEHSSGGKRTSRTAATAGRRVPIYENQFPSIRSGVDARRSRRDRRLIIELEERRPTPASPTMKATPLGELLARRTAEGELYEKLPNGCIRCFACGHRCLIPPGFGGVCRVRFNEDGVLKVPWGYVGALQLDPVEKKPFFHALPGSRALSFGRAPARRAWVARGNSLAGGSGARRGPRMPRDGSCRGAIPPRG
jgi:hypothetical protein